MQHPDIAARTFTTPPGSDECFQHFLAGCDISPPELLAEIAAGIAEHHSQTQTIASPLRYQPEYVVELARFIVVYHLRPTVVEVSTILSKCSPDRFHYVTSTTTLPPSSRPDIAAHDFGHPPANDERFNRFVARCDASREELLTEIFTGLAARHGQATPVSYPPADCPAYLVALPRFVLIYQFVLNRIQVCTLLAQSAPHMRHQVACYLADWRFPHQPPVHPDVADKPITYLQLDHSFAPFASDICDAASAEALLDDLADTIRFRHGRARSVLWPGHARPLWELETHFLRFQYQVLRDKVEVGTIWSRDTGLVYAASQDLLARYTK